MKDSAEYLGFQFDRDKIDEMLSRIITTGSFKVRLTLWKDGRIEPRITRIEELDPVRGVQLAREPIDSSDRFLYHKTTRRGADGVIFWNERGEITESSIANVVIEIDGELFTPPIECGLLPGVFRNHLIAQGTIKERVITVEEFQRADEFFLINSIRKWIRIIRG